MKKILYSVAKFIWPVPITDHYCGVFCTVKKIVIKVMLPDIFQGQITLCIAKTKAHPIYNIFLSSEFFFLFF